MVDAECLASVPGAIPAASAFVFTTEGRGELGTIWEVMVAETQTDAKLGAGLESCPSLQGRIIKSHPPGRQVNQREAGQI